MGCGASVNMDKSIELETPKKETPKTINSIEVTKVESFHLQEEKDISTGIQKEAERIPEEKQVPKKEPVLTEKTIKKKESQKVTVDRKKESKKKVPIKPKTLKQHEGNKERTRQIRVKSKGHGKSERPVKQEGKIESSSNLPTSTKTENSTPIEVFCPQEEKPPKILSTPTPLKKKKSGKSIKVHEKIFKKKNTQESQNLNQFEKKKSRKSIKVHILEKVFKIKNAQDVIESQNLNQNEKKTVVKRITPVVTVESSPVRNPRGIFENPNMSPTKLQKPFDFAEFQRRMSNPNMHNLARIMSESELKIPVLAGTPLGKFFSQPASPRSIAEFVEIPMGKLAIVFTDIQSSTSLWEASVVDMEKSVTLHNECAREIMVHHNGYEVKTEGDSFMIAFQEMEDAINFCMIFQVKLLKVRWPKRILKLPAGKKERGKNHELLWRGLRVRMGIHFGQPIMKLNPYTGRGDYFGPMVNQSARVAGLARGGEIHISECVYDFLMEQKKSTWDHVPVIKGRRKFTLKGIKKRKVIYSLFPSSLQYRWEYFAERTYSESQAIESKFKGSIKLEFEGKLLLGDKGHKTNIRRKSGIGMTDIEKMKIYKRKRIKAEAVKKERMRLEHLQRKKEEIKRKEEKKRRDEIIKRMKENERRKKEEKIKEDKKHEEYKAKRKKEKEMRDAQRKQELARKKAFAYESRHKRLEEEKKRKEKERMKQMQRVKDREKRKKEEEVRKKKREEKFRALEEKRLEEIFLKEQKELIEEEERRRIFEIRRLEHKLKVSKKKRDEKESFRKEELKLKEMKKKQEDYNFKIIQQKKDEHRKKLKKEKEEREKRRKEEHDEHKKMQEMIRMEKKKLDELKKIRTETFSKTTRSSKHRSRENSDSHSDRRTKSKFNLHDYKRKSSRKNVTLKATSSRHHMKKVKSNESNNRNDVVDMESGTIPSPMKRARTVSNNLVVGRNKRNKGRIRSNTRCDQRRKLTPSPPKSKTGSNGNQKN